MAEIHDRKDQLIYVLTGIHASIWIGLFSVGFWQSNPPFWYWIFWTSFFVVTLGMIGLLLSTIACFYYAKYDEHINGLSEEDRSRYDNLARRWKIPWNWYWRSFSIGAIASMASAFSRFAGA